MKNVVFILLISLFSLNVKAQIEKKEVTATRVNETIKIDGNLDESFWDKADEAKDFFQFRPDNRKKEDPAKKTTVKILYDDEAIYFGATMYDDTPEKIPLQFGGRDEFGNVDFFLIAINPNNDGQNETEFVVMSTGAQADAQSTSNNEDFSWNAVWDSEVKITDYGWVAEIKIPYSALRFSNKTNDDWGINFHRKINYQNVQNSWNFIEVEKGQIAHYAGNLKGIKDISPPTRLSFNPFASASFTREGDSEEFNKGFGMDMKYGLSENFTLDVVLIPDFGQTEFDELVLNLGPFEQRYQEKRAFFTEGINLFNKGRLFYSRRIGNTPVGYLGDDDLEENEIITENPESVNMINAVKLSGRTENELGIGVFNAITEKTYATAKDTISNNYRRVLTEPFTNYNVLVLDQQFNKNSSVSLTNTNVLREGHFRDANATSLSFDISDKNNKYNIRGGGKMSYVDEQGSSSKGYSGYLRFSKTHGKLRYALGHFFSGDKYDISDLGYQGRTNYANYFFAANYRSFKPTKKFETYRISLETSLRYLKNPNIYTGNNVELNFFFKTLKQVAFGGNFETQLGTEYDYHEPRAIDEGRYLKQQGVLFGNLWVSTDFRKKLAVDVRLALAKRRQLDSRYFDISISPRYRFTDKFQLVYNFGYSQLNRERGWVNEIENGEETDIIFGKRDIKTVENAISGKLNFNTKSSLSLTFRHYWSPVTYSQFYTLQNNGSLADNMTYNDQHNTNYNVWNLDLGYTWVFAPGSQLIALYRNSIFSSGEQVDLSFKENLNQLFEETKTNIFSLKLVYYIDYNNAKKWFRKKNKQATL